MDVSLLESQRDTKMCRICYEEIGEMISPCKCKGSLLWIHPLCFFKITQGPGNAAQTNRCGICRSLFMFDWEGNDFETSFWKDMALSEKVQILFSMTEDEKAVLDNVIIIPQEVDIQLKRTFDIFKTPQRDVLENVDPQVKRNNPLLIRFLILLFCLFFATSVGFFYCGFIFHDEINFSFSLVYSSLALLLPFVLQPRLLENLGMIFSMTIMLFASLSTNRIILAATLKLVSSKSWGVLLFPLVTSISFFTKAFCFEPSWRRTRCHIFVKAENFFIFMGFLPPTLLYFYFCSIQEENAFAPQIMEGLFIVTMIPFCFFMTRKNESSFSLVQISTSKAFQELPVPANLKMKVFCTVYKKHMEKWVMLARHHEWNKKRNMFFLIWVWILQLVIVCISLMRIILLGSTPHWFWVSPLLSQISFGLICALIWKITRSEDERFEFFDIASNESPLLWKIY